MTRQRFRRKNQFGGIINYILISYIIYIFIYCIFFHPLFFIFTMSHDVTCHTRFDAFWPIFAKLMQNRYKIDFSALPRVTSCDIINRQILMLEANTVPLHPHPSCKCFHSGSPCEIPLRPKNLCKARKHHQP